MLQLINHLSRGDVELNDVPCPAPGPGSVLIRTHRSLVSVGTERMLVDFGRANFLEKARQQPEKVRQVLDKVRTDGLATTLEAVRAKLDEPMPMGYCNVGTVEEVGSGVEQLRAGDRVASNGKHAEMIVVPKNLCARVPDSVPDEAASFTVIGAIALQGVRLAAVSLGEAVVVTGLGLIGLMTVQLLRAQGCRVLGLDFERDKLELARRFGAEVADLAAGSDPVAAAMEFSRGRGVDAVIITASTKSDEPMHQAAQMCRQRGRIILVGVTGLALSRADFYEKELTFQVSCSYGPGRYDPQYEIEGHDYPVGFVRWTEQRNFEAILDMLADGRLDVAPLISHRFALERAADAYQLVVERKPCLGIVLEYGGDSRPRDERLRRTLRVADPPARVAELRSRPSAASAVTIAVIGSGNYARRVLIPALRATSAELKAVASSNGLSAATVARRNGIAIATTDAAVVLGDPAVNTVVIATRHDSHARYVCEALRAGKHVFVEKPLAITRDEVIAIQQVYAQAQRLPGAAPSVMVGFNRRFAPQVAKIRTLLALTREPKAFTLTINAGAIPARHWTQDRQVGGGRIIGEGCHFIDLLRHLAGCRITRLRAAGFAGGSGVRDDKVNLMLEFEDGSIGAIHYLANGHRSFPKERLEVYCGGAILQLENFRRLRSFGWPHFSGNSLWRQDKGQRQCVAAFVHAIANGGPSPIPFNELVEVAEAALTAQEELLA
jgi:predicted dehydrogenase/threonine dehydrogenase-like Zn-dependent dehydrogenase